VQHTVASYCSKDMLVRCTSKVHNIRVCRKVRSQALNKNIGASDCINFKGMVYPKKLMILVKNALVI
jgi:hypothetical protein